MKKIVITIAAVVVAAVAAQAQSPSVEARIMGDMMGRGKLAQANTKKQALLQRRISNAATRAQAQANKKAAEAKKAETAKKAEAAKKAPAKKVTKQTKENEGVGAWLKATFLGGRYPGETDEQYHARLVAQTQPASLPFK